MKNKIFTVIFGVAVFFFIITVSIALPIYCRFFYYLQIGPLNLVEESGYDYATIKFAYDQMLDYLTLPNREFGTGVFKFTPSGASHFADCKALFNLNLIALIISLTVIVLSLVLNGKKGYKLLKPCGHNASFFSAVSVFSVFIIIGVLVAIDFDSAFTVFHHIFFPGKDNWLFDPRYDQILNVLPAEFFLNCGILIISSIILISLALIVISCVQRKNRVKSNINC